MTKETLVTLCLIETKKEFCRLREKAFKDLDENDAMYYEGYLMGLNRAISLLACHTTEELEAWYKYLKESNERKANNE